jgi:hypothetical protein
VFLKSASLDAVATAENGGNDRERRWQGFVSQLSLASVFCDVSAGLRAEWRAENEERKKKSSKKKKKKT